MIVKKVGIIGLGLIGGSLAMTMKRKKPQVQVLACDTKEETRHLALEKKAADKVFSGITPEFASCSLIFLCAPVDVNKALLKSLVPFTKENGSLILSDVSSMKGQIQEEAKALGVEDRFIGGHPMAGTENTGFAHADAYLFENVYFLMTPGEKVPDGPIEEYKAFIKDLDMIPIRLTTKEHDFATACVSHVPHIISAALVNLVRENDTERQTLKTIAAGGFKDITRISSSSPDMWTEITEGNKAQILPVIDQYIASLQEVRSEIAKEEEGKIRSFFADAKEYRDSINQKKGNAYRESFVLYCDLIDEAGEIATIATRLATHRISIRNIGIINNREFQDGVLSIEFYDAKALADATGLLRKFRYHIYEPK